MENLLDKLKQLEAPQIIVSILILACAVFVAYGVFRPSDNESNGASTEILEFPDTDNTTEDYDSKLEAYQLKEEKESGLELKFDGKLFGGDNDDMDTEVYKEEEDERIQELQNQIRLMEEKRKNLQEKNATGAVIPTLSDTKGAGTGSTGEKAKMLSAAEKEALYRSQLLKAREERLARSQDYSAPLQGATQTDRPTDFLEFRAAIYRDQFILPGDRVTLILTQPITYRGNVFKKNTFIYANANIRGSRVLMDVTNIDHVPIQLYAKDVADGNTGMHSQRAGELWSEFQAETQTRGMNDVAGELARGSNVPLVGTAIRAFGQFFKKKRYRQKDKILLVNDDKLILTSTLNQ